MPSGAHSNDNPAQAMTTFTVYLQHKECRQYNQSTRLCEAMTCLQTSSRNTNEPNAKIGTGSRFGQYKTTFKNDFDVPAASSWTPAAGWMGDAPTYSFHGHSKRADIAKGLPGFKPTPGETPGPGTYEAPLAFGPQAMSKRESVPRTRIGTADREQTRNVFVTKGHERERYGIHSPSPNAYNPSLKAVSARTPQPGCVCGGTYERNACSHTCRIQHSHVHRVHYGNILWICG